MAAEKFTFFWTKESPFSQFYPSPFKADGCTFSCAEQYMMYRKAKLFNDPETADAIIAETRPAKMKALGRGVSGFDMDVWKEHRWDIVHSGSVAKFSQNEQLLRALLDTKGTTLVEASPSDCIWGIGLAESSPHAKDRSKWRGLNLLGQILTQVREELQPTVAD